MTPQSQAIVRQFFATSAAQEWLEHVRDAYPRLEIGKVDHQSYNAALLESSGWDKCIRYGVACVQEKPLQDFGLQPIDTVQD